MARVHPATLRPFPFSAWLLCFSGQARSGRVAVQMGAAAAAALRAQARALKSTPAALVLAAWALALRHLA
eukprot:819187-Pyramimonas_sp.AAC.1